MEIIDNGVLEFESAIKSDRTRNTDRGTTEAKGAG